MRRTKTEAARGRPEKEINDIDFMEGAESRRGGYHRNKPQQLYSTKEFLWLDRPKGWVLFSSHRGVKLEEYRTTLLCAGSKGKSFWDYPINIPWNIVLYVWYSVW